jgi:hypothetical protein
VFCKVGLSLLLGVCGLFFLDDLQSLDHLEEYRSQKDN